MGRESHQFSVAAAVLACLCAGSALAQNPAPGPGSGADTGGSGSRRVFDRTEVIIGDRVILESTVDRELEANRDPAQPLPLDAREALRSRIVHQILREELWVQQGKVLGNQAPDVFEEYVERSVDERMDELVEDYGSVTRTISELQAIGQSWRDTREAYRNEILSQIAKQQAMSQRFGTNATLLVTPEEMLDYFEENRAQFSARREAQIAWVAFLVRGGDRQAALERARRAAEAWRTQPLGADELAQQFEGVALRTHPDVCPDDPADSRAAFMKEFARSEPGTVSEPVEQGDSLFVMKVESEMDRPEADFTDQAVQNEIRRRLVEAQYEEFEARVFERKLQNLFRLNLRQESR